MRIFDAQKYKQILDNKIQEYIAANPVTKKLGIVQLGDDEASTKYINLKKKYCAQFGIEVEHLVSDTDQDILNFLSRRDLGGIIIQLPIPDDKKNLLNKIPQDKDIDCLNKSHFTSPVVKAVSLFLEEVGDFESAVVIGDGVLIGKPIYNFLGSRGKDVRLEDSYSTGTKLSEDVIVVGVDSLGLVCGQDLNADASVVDFGVGAFDVKSEIEHLNVVCPSPGGMGPLVVRFLVMNFLGI